MYARNAMSSTPLAARPAEPLPFWPRGLPEPATPRAERVVQWHMLKMTPEEGRAYVRRWQLLRAVEVVELQRTSMDTKLQQLAALMASRDAFGPEPDRDAQIRDVRERWARLRQALGG